MRSLSSLTLLVAGCGLIASAVVLQPQQLQNAQDKSPSTQVSIDQAAQRFLATLSGDALSKAVLSYDAPQRTEWKFIPLPTRKGLPLREMNDAQREAAHGLFQSIVSALGYEKATTIMSMEGLLRILEGPESHERRDPSKYYFTVYGQPSSAEKWGVSIEGHHLSLNFVIEAGKVVESTPQFFAANPATLKADYSDKFQKGMRVLHKEEQLAFDLLESFDVDQAAKAVVADEPPAEILSIDRPHAEIGEAKGISTSQLTEKQNALLRDLITTYTESMLEDVAAHRWEKIESHGWDKVHFAWLGARQPGIGHYYVIQGPSFLVEFVNTQADAAGNPANHIHCVWRDADGDFYLPRESKSN